MDKYKVAIIGAAGYTGTELVRLLLGHPSFELVAATSSSENGQSIAQRFPAFMGHTDLTFTTVAELEELKLDAVFLAVPHTAALDIAPHLLEMGISVIDLSADFRLKDAAVYEEWYKAKHSAPELLAKAVYGLPELYRLDLVRLAELRANNGEPALVACPGCYPTASALAVAPTLAAGAMMPRRPVVINAVSGASGMGRTAQEASHFVTINEDARAYNVGTHRHIPEIEQTFSTEARQPITVQFTPVLIPMTRGLLATATINLLPGLNKEVLEVIYSTAYSEEPFVKLLPYGKMPQTSHVSNTNQAQLGMFFDEHTDQLVVSCAIDNLGKGASSQALQCANIIFGLPETSGLISIGSVI
ncbi:MAG: N-acetyl-gamma-glutamyl-phosphate reductase [Coriobacteriales bacterium]|nr:N-acetyl-gamma-glutamyl-phosphate reductase [Coriobacteriales bacterium]